MKLRTDVPSRFGCKLQSQAGEITVDANGLVIEDIEDGVAQLMIDSKINFYKVEADGPTEEEKQALAAQKKAEADAKKAEAEQKKAEEAAKKAQEKADKEAEALRKKEEATEIAKQKKLEAEAAKEAGKQKTEQPITTPQ